MMILTFPIDDETTGCIAWGKITMGRFARAKSPVRINEYKSGSERLSFYLNITTKRTGSGKNAQIEYETATVSIWQREGDPTSEKLGGIVRRLRKSDYVLVFGKYETRPWTDEHGTEQTAREITALGVIPMVWLYDIFLALFDQIVAKAELPVLKRPPKNPGGKGQAPKPTIPETAGRNAAAPQITHPVVLEEEDWFT